MEATAAGDLRKLQDLRRSQARARPITGGAWLATRPRMRPRPLIALMLVSGLVQSACGSGPRPSPRTPIATLGAFSTSGARPAPPRFWTAFGDPALDALVEQALTAGFDVPMAWARLRQADAAARAAGASRFPTVDASAGAGASASGLDATRTSVSVGVAASYELDLWGGVAAGRDAATWSAHAARADVDAAAITVAAQLATAWYRRATAVAEVALLAQDLATSEATLALVAARVGGGVAPDSDRLRQTQAVEALRGQLAVARAAVRTQVHAINALRGAAPDAALPAAPALPTLPALPATGVPATILGQRPDVAAAWARVEAADRAVAQAVAERYPRVSLSASLASTGQLEGWLANLAANLVAPLVDGGSRAAAVDRARGGVDLALLAYRQAVVAAAVEVEDALVDEAAQADLVASLDRQLALAAATSTAVRAQYVAGATDQLHVLAAEQSYQGVARARLAAATQAVYARIALYRALAGPFPLAAPAEPAVGTRNPQAAAAPAPAPSRG